MVGWKLKVSPKWCFPGCGTHKWGKPTYSHIPNQQKLIKLTFCRLWGFVLDAFELDGGLKTESLWKVGFIGFVGLGANRTLVHTCMLILFGETICFTVSEPKQPTKPTSQWLWDFNRHSSPKVFRESRFSENSNMYSRTKVLYVPLWKCWLLLGKNQLLCGARTNETNKTNFSETFSFQPTIHFKRVQRKFPKSTKSVFYLFFWVGMCE